MSHSLHVILRCDHKVSDGDHASVRCPEWVAAKAHLSVPEARDWAAGKGWTFKPGQPYPHIGGRDSCPAHTPN